MPKNLAIYPFQIMTAIPTYRDISTIFKAKKIHSLWRMDFYKMVVLFIDT